MKFRWISALVAISLVGIPPAQATETTIEPMSAKLETRFALSAVPPGLRDRATVYLLDPRKGYHLSRQGTSGVTCVVERTAWELADFRNDIYIPLCYDAVGTKTYLNVIMDAAALRAQGMGPAALKAEIEKRYRDQTYDVPEKAGLFWHFIGPVPVTFFNFGFQGSRGHPLRAKRGRVHDDFQVRLRPRGVVAERNVDVVAKVGQFPGSALDDTRHTARSLPGKMISLLGVKEINGCPVPQSRRHCAECELSFELGRHLPDRRLGRLAWRSRGHANEADCD